MARVRRAGSQTAGPRRLRELGDPPKGPAGIVVGKARRRTRENGTESDSLDQPAGGQAAALRRRAADRQLLDLADALDRLANDILDKSPAGRQDLHDRAVQLANVIRQLAAGIPSPWVAFAQLAQDLGRADSQAEAKRVTEQLLGWPPTRLYPAAEQEPVLDLHAAPPVIEAATVTHASDLSAREQAEQHGPGLWVGNFSSRTGYRIFLGLNPDAAAEGTRPPMIEGLDPEERKTEGGRQ
jgi:hypothetical protein